jgi:hypothetical protein
MRVKGHHDSIAGSAEATGGIGEHEARGKKIRRWLGAVIEGIP